MKTILETWARRWQNLRAWGRPLEEISFTVVGRNNHKEPGEGGACSTGTAWPMKRVTVIRAGSELVDALVTILHEYAHLAAPAGAGHDLSWSTRYIAAVKEVTGIRITGATKVEVDRGARGAIGAWWKSSGNQFAAELLMRRTS